MRNILRILIIGFTAALVAVSAHADIPTVGYLTQFYNNICHNPNLNLINDGAPGAIPSRRRTLEIIDWLNNGTTVYADEFDGGAIASVGYVTDTLNLLGDNALCCPGGYWDNTISSCQSCGVWSVDSAAIECLSAGEYRNGNSCSPCPDGYTCPAGTSGKINNLALLVQCLAVNEFRLNNQCHECGAGYRCPAGKNARTDCGVGYWCADGIATECEWGANQCPLLNHTAADLPVACDRALTFTN